jgi:hypothetical protein
MALEQTPRPGRAVAPAGSSAVRQPASVLHDELRGTAAADFPDSWRALHRRSGLGDDWIVVGLDLAGSYRSSWGAVLAIPMPAGGRFVAWEQLVAAHGGQLPVRRFPLAASSLNADVPDGLGMLTELKRWSMRLTIAPLVDVELVVLVDQPAQE